MRLIAVLIVPPLLIFGMLLAILFLRPPGLPPQVSGDLRQRVALVLAVPAFLAYLALVAGTLLSTFDQPGKVLDRQMAGYTLPGRRAGVFGRRYEGELQGRRVSIDFQPAAAPRSHVLDVNLWPPAPEAPGSQRAARAGLAATAASLSGLPATASSLSSPAFRAAIGTARPLLACLDCVEVPFSEPDLEGVHVFARDAAWIRSVLAHPEVRRAAAVLVRGDGWGGPGELYLRADSAWLRGHPRLAQGDAAGWVTALLEVTQAAAAVPTAE